jgi:uncharacterized protein
MPRPKKPRRLSFSPSVRYFKPQGVPLRQLTEVTLFPDEVEALKLHEEDGLQQTEAAARMHISQPTFARTLASAYQKISLAILTGKAIKLLT